MLIAVVLPAPLGPIRPWISPSGMSSASSLNAARPPKRLDTPRRLSAGPAEAVIAWAPACRRRARRARRGLLERAESARAVVLDDVRGLRDVVALAVERERAGHPLEALGRAERLHDL